MKYFGKKYPHLPMKETTVRRLKNLNCKASSSQLAPLMVTMKYVPLTENIPKLPLKKTGQPLMIGEELDQQVQEYIKYFRKTVIGAVVNTDVMIATGNGILMSKDANLLSSITLTKAWAKYLN